MWRHGAIGTAQRSLLDWGLGRRLVWGDGGVQNQQQAQLLLNLLRGRSEAP